MGCCVSSHSHENRASAQKQSSAVGERFHCISKSPPRPEEESVKEVLSETPKPRPDLDPTPGFKIPKSVAPKTEHEDEEEELMTKPKIFLTPKKTRPGTHPRSPDPTPPAPACSTPEEISDSLSLSECISTSTLRERDEDEVQVQQWSKNSQEGGGRGYSNHISQGQNGNLTRNNRAFRSPVKRVEPGQRRNPSPVQRRERGENTGRRSRSPGNVSRSPSGRRTGPSPGRVRMVHGPNEGPMMKALEERARDRERERERERESESEWQGPNESLENPLVSLECFIFL